MAPNGRKQKHRADQVDEPLTVYERKRLDNMMRNNQRMQLLGVSTLASLLRQSTKRSKASKKGHAKDKEVLVDEVVDGILPHNTMTSGGLRSKRVRAVGEQIEPARMTRQRTKELQVQASNEGPMTQHEDVNGVADGPTTQHKDQIYPSNEGQENSLQERWRGVSMGKGLDKLTRGLNYKIPVHIAEGHKRPEAPIQAAKFASEGGIILRQHIPVLPHCKEYKKKENMCYFQEFKEKISGELSIDTNNKNVEAACFDLLKSGARQFRHRLKKKYFDGVPANEVLMTSPIPSISDELWIRLVQMWDSLKHKKKCAANKLNRAKVQFQQRTGSRCYLAQGHVIKQQEQFKDSPPNALDLFKGFHYSSKTGFDEPVKEAIAQMEAILEEPVEERQEAKTPTEALAQVLQSRKFLQNAGLEAAGTKRSTKIVVAAAQVQELQTELQATRQGSAELKENYEALKEECVGSKKEIEKLKKDNEETQALLRRLLTINNNKQ